METFPLLLETDRVQYSDPSTWSRKTRSLPTSTSSLVPLPKTGQCPGLITKSDTLWIQLALPDFFLRLLVRPPPTSPIGPAPPMLLTHPPSEISSRQLPRCILWNSMAPGQRRQYHLSHLPHESFLLVAFRFSPYPADTLHLLALFFVACSVSTILAVSVFCYRTLSPCRYNMCSTDPPSFNHNHLKLSTLTKVEPFGRDGL
jgi:hypothetical protein